MKTVKLMTAFILVFLFSAFFTVSTIRDACANPVGMLMSIWRDKIDLDSPRNMTYNVKTVPVNITIEYIETWSRKAYYTLNKQNPVYLTPDNETKVIHEGHTYTPSSNQNTTFRYATYIGQYNFLLYNLTDGTYNFTVQRVRTAVSAIFVIDTAPPKISDFTLENKTIPTSNVPIHFVVNEPVSKITYSLDTQENKTITGNTTLTRIPDGQHTLTIYVNDTAGNTAKSNPVTFMVKTSTPTPSITKVPTQATASSNEIENSKADPDVLGLEADAGLVSIVVVGLTILMVVTALVYFKKGKR